MNEHHTIPSVRVLLSTYNGEQYVETQLESLSEQTGVRLDVMVRDDGSKDRTVALLNKWKERMPITLVQGDNRGAVASFMELVYATDLSADYYAFCDQDDYWLPEKLTAAIQSLASHEQTKPLLYCSAQTITDAELNPQFISEKPQRPVGFSNALVQNIATGCTVVVNRALLRTVQQKRVDPKAIVMHDWWMLLIASGLGQVIYDPVPRILYRQHGKNEVGHARGMAFWKTRARRFLFGNKAGILRKQAQAFSALYGDMLRSKDKELLDNCLGKKSGLTAALTCVGHNKLHRQRAIDNWILRFLFLVGKL